MKKKIWIWNHYATNMYFDKAGRHYSLSKYLLRQGYDPTIFCASTNHFSGEEIDLIRQSYRIENTEGIKFIFLKTAAYSSNGISRVINVVNFFTGLLKEYKKIASETGKPDLILASSVHPLTLVAGILTAKKLKVPCVCEVRDLWPESLVAYGYLNRNAIITKLLYGGEKWIYKRADAVVMTWEGGKKYIQNMSWENVVGLDKIHYISNGVDLETFDNNCLEEIYRDTDLEDHNFINIVYTGSIRKVNNIGVLLDAAQILKLKGISNIRFLIYGSGNELEILKKRSIEEGIDNVIFKGRVDKKYVPSVLSQADVNILHNASTSLDQYGQSQNKLFEYLAAGRCIIQTYTTDYSVIDRTMSGVSVFQQTPELIADEIIKLCGEGLDETYGQNARKAAETFSYDVLSQKLIQLIETL